jgi:putative membrane protein
MKKLMAISATVTLVVFGVAGVPGPVVAQTDEPTTVIDYETVFASLDSDGAPRNVRLVDTIRVSGEGDVVVTDPTSTEDFRVLSGFQSPEVGDGEVTYTIEDLSGTEEFVTASTPDVAPPVSMRVVYYLDGELVEAEDVVGETGRVTIVFDVTNDTGASTELTYKDAAGEEQSFTQEVPVPMVAQLQMELPGDRVTNIFAPEAEKITDPQGDITLQWSMVMVPPIGSTVQSPMLMMDAEDFELGAIRLLAVPVAPVEREFLNFAEEEFQGGVDKASGLYEGATELSSSIEELHDGTLDLLDGMQQLLDGAQELAAGLVEAFTGSGKLTAGLGEAVAGSGELTAGLFEAQSGSGRITGGLGDLKGGLKRIGGGLDLLSEGLPAGQAGAEDISEAADGIQQIAAALASNLGTLAAGAGSIGTGAAQIQAGAGQIQTGATGIQTIAGSVGPPLQAASALCDADPDCATIVTAMLTAHACLVGASCGGNPTISQIAGSINTGAGQISAGAGQIVGGANAIQAGANAVAACLTGSGTPCSGNPSVSAIAGLVEAGALELAQGVADALDGLGQLSAGVDEAIDGSKRLFAGSQDLTAGLGEAVEGGQKLTAGLGEAASGSGELTAGLGKAASGSDRLAEGIGEAKGGAGLIEQGVYSVNELGVKEIARNANDTVSELARSLALMKAQDKRANEEALTYGPPSSDQARTVVGGSGVVLTMDQLDNRSTESAARGIGAAVGFLALVALGLLGARSLSRRPG